MNEVLDFEDEIFARPFATTREVALHNEIPLQGFSPWADREHLIAGDTATILVTGTGMHERKQWLILLRVDDRDEDTPEGEPPRDEVLYTNSGREIHFADSPVVLQMRTWGPFVETTTSKNSPVRLREAEDAREIVNESFLRLGFANACEAMMQLHRARTEGRLAPDNLFSVGIKPFSGRELKRGLQLAEAAGFETDDERAIAGTVPALLEYFDIASRSPGIRSLVWELLEKPSVWSVLGRIGRIESGVIFHTKGVGPVSEEPWALPAVAEVFKIPLTLELNDRPGLQCVLVVTHPRPPLLVSAGIIGILAQSPGDDAKRLFLRIVAARTAEPRESID